MLETNKQPDSWKEKVPSVSVLTRQLRGHLENTFFDIWIKGEISGFKKPVSGHGYFSIKDDNAQIAGVMWRTSLSKLKFEVEDGMEIIAHGKITVYEPRGTYQIVCDHIEPIGVGALQKAFEQLKAKLNKEGLFDPKHKKTIPILPKKIGVITSQTGAAFSDILRVLDQRFSNREVLLIPASVQGEKAAGEIVASIEKAQRWNQENPNNQIDTLVVGRGGGSLEDLWPFNEETVARAIFNCEIPIISAVGHEIDTTISDFVADIRAATPSAAVEIAVPDKQEWLSQLNYISNQLLTCFQKNLTQHKLNIGHLSKRLISPSEKLKQMKYNLNQLTDQLIQIFKNQIKLKKQILKPYSDETLKLIINKNLKLTKQRIGSLTQNLHHLSPLQVISRGYSISQLESGKVLRSITEVKKDNNIKHRLTDGWIHTRVTHTEKED